MDAGSRGHAKAVRIVLGERTSRRTSTSTSVGLTPRECEVAVLIAYGLTSREIAAQLRMSAGTVNVHVGHILRKLGLHKRAAIAAWVATQPDRLSRSR